MSVSKQNDGKSVEIKSFNESVPALADLLELSEVETEQVAGGKCSVLIIFNWKDHDNSDGR